MKRNRDKFKSTIPRLTINHIAAATLRTSRKAWRGVAVGIFLSLFLISAMVLSVQGVMAAQKERIAQKVGYEDCFLLDYPEMTDQQLKDSGRFDAIGRVYVTAQINGGDRYVGYYDDTAAALLNRRVMEGRMPEAAGEIALDQGMLEYLRADAGLGGKLTLDLMPIGGLPETRDFTLVGILADQSLETNMWSSEWALHVYRFPSALVSAEEPAFATGRVAIHRVMTLARGVSLQEVMAHNWEDYDDYMFFISEDGHVTHWYDNMAALQKYLNITTLIVILLGLSLVLSACVGVAQAMEGQLSRRVEEIGMLRAVGATRRQIRRIFGRQTWLIALVLAPFSIGMGCAFAWLLSRLLPGTVLFRPSLGVIAPMLILSVACIWLSSSLPLRRASRIMPMSVIRDTQLLRKAKRIKSQTDFKPAWLLAARQTRLYPTRQIGAALMAALMLFCAFIGVLGAMESMKDTGIGYDMSIINQDSIWTERAFSDVDRAGRFLTEGDVGQLRALPHVRSVVTCRHMQVNLLFDGVPDYLTASNEYLAGEDIPWISVSWEEETRAMRTRAPLVQALLDTDKTIAQFPLKTISLPDEALKALADYATEGRIDIEALDAGREVLVYAPTIYQFERSDSIGRSIGRGVYKDRHDRKEKLVYTWENDAFHAGDTLEMAQIIGEESKSQRWDSLWDATPEEYTAWLESCELRRESVKIGAVLRAPDVYDKSWPLSDIGENSFILTTEKGLKAMGLHPKVYSGMEIYLDGAVDEETGDYLSARVAAIAARAEDAYVYDGIRFARVRRQEMTQVILAFSAMTVMFFAVTVGLVSGNVSRRIHSDQRMIGTLRAVGADARVLMKCYGAQISAGLVAGFVAALLIAVLFLTTLLFGITAAEMAASLSTMLALAALCLVCCLLTLRQSLRETMKKSIVENIREL